MCSTFKALAAAAALKRVDAGADGLDRKIAFGPADLLEYAPVSKAHVADGAMSLADACAAALQWSDNTAANLVLEDDRRPAGRHRLGARARRFRHPPRPRRADAQHGDSRRSARHDQPGGDGGRPARADPRRRAVAGLAPPARSVDGGDKVGDKRLRAGLPADWGIADKTGTGDHGVANTIAILRPPSRPPLFVAVYFAESDRTPDERNAVHRDVARVIVETM